MHGLFINFRHAISPAVWYVSFNEGFTCGTSGSLFANGQSAKSPLSSTFLMSNRALSPPPGGQSVDSFCQVKLTDVTAVETHNHNSVGFRHASRVSLTQAARLEKNDSSVVQPAR